MTMSIHIMATYKHLLLLMLHLTLSESVSDSRIDADSAGMRLKNYIEPFIVTDDGARNISAQLKCPPKCICHHDNKTNLLVVNCSNKHLKTVPAIATNTNKLLLNINRLKALKTGQFYNLVELIFLDLSQNMIEILQSGCFRGLSKLRYLSLRSNHLHKPNNIGHQIFKPLERLSTLNLANNCRHKDSCWPLMKEVGTVYTLTSLYISDYQGITFPEVFRNLTKLLELSFTGNDDCNINYITHETFANLAGTPLQTVDIGECNIKQVQSGSFSIIRSLKMLDISGNREFCQDGWRNATNGLNATSIRILDLGYNCVQLLPNNHTISELDLLSLSRTKLESLNMQHCDVQIIQPRVITDALPETLQSLQLNDNGLNSPFFLIFLQWLPNLQRLDISKQGRYNSIPGQQNLKKSEQSTYLTYFTEANSSSRYFDSGCFIKLPVFQLPPRLRFLNASNLNLGYPFPKIVFHSNNSLETVDAHGCLIPVICGKIGGLHRLKYLNLAGNRITYISSEAFVDMPLLEDLNLSGNQVGDIFDNSQSVSIFNGLSSLTKLDLSSTKIKRLPKSIFSNLHNLRILSLKDNALETIEFDIGNFIDTLQVLDISNNAITYLPDFVTNDLEKLEGSSVFVLYISHNKLSCDCDHVSFSKWIANTKVNIYDHSNITCRLSNETNVEIHNLKAIDGEMALGCVTWAVVTACVSCFLGLLIVLSLIAALYRQRWTLRYHYYTSLKRVNPYALFDNPVENSNDIYLSFDEDHEFADDSRLYDFVTIEVLKVLEEKGFNVIFREKLYIGRSLHSQISTAIQQCRKTVVFLSRDYCKEFWNTFEFNIAACHEMHTRQKVIVPVLVEEIKCDDLLPEFKAYLNKEKIVQFKEGNFNELVEELFHMISK